MLADMTSHVPQSSASSHPTKPAIPTPADLHEIACQFLPTVHTHLSGCLGFCALLQHYTIGKVLPEWWADSVPACCPLCTQAFWGMCVCVRGLQLFLQKKTYKKVSM